MNFTLINPENLNTFLKDNVKNNPLLNALYVPLMQQDSCELIQNVHVDTQLLSTGERTLGLILPRATAAYPDESYVASPYGQYVDYGRYETALELGKLRWLNRLANGIFNVLGEICRKAKFDQVVLIDNLLFSTNLYPQKTDYDLAALHKFLVQQFPDRALVFRSICPEVYPEWFQHLKSQGYKAVFSRQVYLLRAHEGAHRLKRALDIDTRLASKQKHLCWTILDAPTDLELERILDL